MSKIVKKPVIIGSDYLRLCKLVAIVKGMTVSSFVEYCIAKVIEDEGILEKVPAEFKKNIDSALSGAD